MRPIMGVRARGNGLQQNEYRCQRCGIINTFNECRVSPTWCRDCTSSGDGAVAVRQQNGM